MKQDVFLCEQKGDVFIKIETEENIQDLIEREKDGIPLITKCIKR